MNRREAVLVLLTVIWGGTFLVTQAGLQAGGPFAFLATRFGVGAIALIALSLPVLRGLTAREVRGGAIIGALIAVGFVGQTIGLQTLDTGKSAFLTALYVPLVPLIELAAFRRRPDLATALGVVLACAGVAAMSSPDLRAVVMGTGEWLTVGCAVVTAFEIVLIGRLGPGTDPRRMAIVQLVVAAVLCGGAGLATGEPLPAPSWRFFLCAAGLGAASAFVQVTMNWAQRTVPAARATVIYTLEPVWAAIFGRVAGERLGAAGFLGAGLILAGVLVSVRPWGLYWRRAKDEVDPCPADS